MKKHRSSQQQSDSPETAPEFSGEEYCGARIWREGDVVHIDVRKLEPPDPLVATIVLIESGKTNDLVYFHHDRDPLLLYQELAERGWAAEIVSRTDEEILLKLQPSKSAGGPQ